MHSDLPLESIRLGRIGAGQAWAVLSSVIQTQDQALATKICDALRSWTWRALDRRRRDPELREWLDLLNRIEAQFASRFESDAAKIAQLAELVHESISVAELVSPDDLLHRKNVLFIMEALVSNAEAWADQTHLIAELNLDHANAKLLIDLLIDVGWIEQIFSGGKIFYRASTEGMSRVRVVK
jgi:predicted transcriptional regulator